jgi:hypothetical protein
VAVFKARFQLLHLHSPFHQFHQEKKSHAAAFLLVSNVFLGGFKLGSLLAVAMEKNARKVWWSYEGQTIQ